MKKFNLSLVAVLAMGTFAIAGGDIEPVEPTVVVPMVEEAPMVESAGGFYVGAAYSIMSLDLDRDNYGVNNNWDLELDYDAIMLQAGYKINDFVAVEARYWGAIGDGDATLSNHRLSVTDENRFDTNDITAWGIYAKPMYPVTESADVYALLGYANTDSDFGDDAWDDGAFSWGIGAAFSFSENASVFVDYVSLYNDDSNDANGDLEVTIDTINFGVNYQF